MGNPIPPGDGLAPLVDRLGAQDRRLRELETFDATQYAKAIETLQEQQAELEEQQAELEEQQAALASQVANQVSPAVGQAQNTGFGISVAYSTSAAFNLVVPSGFTRVVISASGGVAAIPSTAINGIYVAVNIGGDVGGSVYGYTDGTFGGSASASHAVSLSNLAAGATIPVSVQSRWHGATSVSLGQSRATVVAQAIFLR